MIALAFYLFSALILTSAVMVVRAKNPVHSVLFLIFSFFNAAGLLLLMGAEFLAMLLVVVYVGAVAVLFLFVVMMIDIQPRTLQKSFRLDWSKFLTSTLSFGLFSILTAGFAVLFFIGMMNMMTFFEILPVAGQAFAFSFLTENPGTLALSAPWHALGSVILNDPLSSKTLALGASIVISVGLATLVAEMLTARRFNAVLTSFFKHFPVGWALTLVLATELVIMTLAWQDAAVTKDYLVAGTQIATNISNTQALGQLIYTDYLLIFQLSGLILLVAMIGAIVLTLRTRPGVKRQSIYEQVTRKKSETCKLVDVKSGEGA